MTLCFLLFWLVIFVCPRSFSWCRCTDCTSGKAQKL